MDADYPPDCPPIRAGATKNELLLRLKTLSEALQETASNEQDGTPGRFENLGVHLGRAEFLTHHDKNVQVWLACCLADVFRIFAPSNPFNDVDQLKDVMLFLVHTLKGLDSPNDPLFRRYFYLLEILFSVNIFYNVTELPGDEPCIVLKQLIKTTMDIVNSKEWAKNREVSEELDNDVTEEKDDDKSERKEKMHHMLCTVVTRLIEKLDNITIAVMDVLFYYLINPQKGNYREAYFMARNIIQASQRSLDAPIESLLTRSLLVSGLPEECELVGSSLKKLYDVIIELNEVVPLLVTPVIPQIGNFLREDEETRVAAMKAIAAIAQNPNSRLLDDYGPVWSAYIQRSRDSVPKIRITFTKQVLNILLSSTQLRGSACEALCRLLKDSDESVRMEALNTAYEAARRKLDSVNEDVIKLCCERMFDPKHAIRADALQKLMNIYTKVICGEEFTSSDKQVVTTIAESALGLYRNPNHKEEHVKMERFLASSLIPYKLETEKRVRHMIDLHAKLSLKAALNLRLIILRTCSYRRLMKEISILLCKDMPNEVKMKEVEYRIDRIAKDQLHPSVFVHMMRKLANWLGEDRTAFDRLSYILSTDAQCSKVSETLGQMFMSAQESKIFSKEENTLLRHFMERLAPLILDADAAEVIVRAANKLVGDSGVGKEGSQVQLQRLLTLMMTWCDQNGLPHVFLKESVYQQLSKLASSDNPGAACAGLGVMQRAFQVPKASEEATAVYKEEAKKLLEELMQSDDPHFARCSKLAVLTYHKLCTPEECLQLFREVWTQSVDRLSIFRASCLNALRVMMAIFKLFPNEFEEECQKLTTEIIVKNIILSSETAIGDPKDVDLCEEKLIHLKQPKYTLVKAYGVKFLCRQLNGKPELDSLSKKTIKLHSAFLEFHGNIFKDDEAIEISPVEMAIMRATVGSQLIHMTRHPKYQNLITHELYHLLGNLVLDEAHSVRHYFVSKLIAANQRSLLIVEYLAYFALLPMLKDRYASPEVDKFVLEQTALMKQGLVHRVNFIRAGYVKLGNRLPFWQPEYILAHVCYLLAVNPICSDNEDVYNLELLRECIWFVIDLFLQNKAFFDFNLMYKIFQQVRQCTAVYGAIAVKEKKMSTAEAQNIDKKMWALADLGMCMLSYRAKLPIRDEPGDEPILSAKFFKRIEKPNIPVYAPDEMIEDEQKRNGKQPTDRKKRANGTTTTASKSRMAGKKADEETSSKGRKKPAAKNPRGAGKRMKPIVEDSSEESEDIDSEEEVLPAPSKRVAKSHLNGDTSPAKRGKQPEREKSPDEHDSSPEIVKPPHKARGAPIMSLEPVLPVHSLMDINLSPIAKSTPNIKSMGSARRGLISSTPLAISKVRTRAPKITIEPIEEEPVTSQSSPEPKKTRGAAAKKPAAKPARNISKSPAKPKSTGKAAPSAADDVSSSKPSSPAKRQPTRRAAPTKRKAEATSAPSSPAKRSPAKTRTTRAAAATTMRATQSRKK